MGIKRDNKNNEGLLDFLRIRGFRHKVFVMKSTALTFKSGLAVEDMYFFLIVSFKAMSIRASDTEKIKINDRFYAYLFYNYCLIKDVNDRNNRSLQLYERINRSPE